MLIKLCIIELITNKKLPKKKNIFNLSSKYDSLLINEFNIKEISKNIAEIENADGNKNKPIWNNLVTRYFLEIEGFLRYKNFNIVFIFKPL